MKEIYSKENIFKFNPTGEIIMAWIVIGILIILAIIIGILARKADFRKRPKGLLLLAEWAVEKLDGFCKDTMGKGFENFGGILLGIIPFLSLSLVMGITGLPTPMSNLAVPLSLGLVSFSLIHYTSMRYTKWGYFKRFIDPLPILLPINLLSMWAPLISMSLRLFGNAIVGWVIMSLLNYVLEMVSAMLFSFAGGASALFLVPIGTPLLHAYFDCFSTFIQTMVFVFLTSLLVSQERPDDIDDELPSRKEI